LQSPPATYTWPSGGWGHGAHRVSAVAAQGTTRLPSEQPRAAELHARQVGLPEIRVGEVR